MRTRLILAEGAPPTTHRSIRQALIADAYTSNATRLKLVLEALLAALRRRASKPRLPCTKVRDGDAHDCRKQPADGVHHAEEILPSPLTAKLRPSPCGNDQAVSTINLRSGGEICMSESVEVKRGLVG
jgi:hypothetical protein